MTKVKLDAEERELLEAYESGEFELDLDAERREYLTKVAEETCKKDRRINIRISSRDLEALQRRALEEGLPYQSLWSQVFCTSICPVGSRTSLQINDDACAITFEHTSRRTDVSHLNVEGVAA